jgi:DNA segregation ATPase FtsK/SpoIIIE, S-DNA-T family
MLTAPPPPPPRITLPQRPAPPARPPFPVVATIAPVAMSLVLWLVTQSVFSLIFAALGPAIAVASLADARLGGRRRSRVEQQRFEVELATAVAEVAVEHDRERLALDAIAPSAAVLADGDEPVHWGAVRPLLLGTAERRSRLSLDGTADRSTDASATSLRALRESAATLADAPLLVDAGGGIGVVGSPGAAAAFARALVVQLLAVRSPVDTSVRGGEPWLRAGPHRWAADRESATVIHADDQVTIAIATELAALPPGLSTVVQLVGVTGEVVRGAETGQRFAPELLTTAQAQRWAERARTTAERTGMLAADAALPTAVSFATLRQPSGAGLACAVGQAADGPLVLDLLAEGPHAVVGGTTGSGKSELLIAWLLAMAASRSPAELTFLLFDFKGGSSFGDLPRLPHCVGLVTDLDGPGVARAVESLAAELRHRERVLAAAGARAIEQVPALARLVIVVDEFAAMAAELPELHARFADLAARGRSLGVHLVLCTQKPAGVVRDGVLANVSLRVSMRVIDRADSVAVIGTPAAAVHCAPGRVWVARAGAEPTPAQVAMVEAADVAAVAARWGSDWHPRRPWLDPLPALLEKAAPGAIGLVDRPGEQAQPPLEWHPLRDGNLLVAGTRLSGKSSALRAIAAVHGAVVVAPGVEAAWDALDEPRSLLLLDDVDDVLSRLAPDYQQAYLDRLATALRSGSGRVALTVQRQSAALQQLAALCDSRLLLRMPSRQEHVLAGGSGELFDPALPPGGGYYRGERVQLVLPAGPREAAPTTSEPWIPRGPALAVSPRPRALAARLSNPGVEVTDPDSWLADWGRYSTLARQQPVLFHECSPTEFRQLSRRRTLPPPIADPRSTGWLLEPEGEARRVRLEGD